MIGRGRILMLWPWVHRSGRFFYRQVEEAELTTTEPIGVWLSYPRFLIHPSPGLFHQTCTRIFKDTGCIPTFAIPLHPYLHAPSFVSVIYSIVISLLCVHTACCLKFLALLQCYVCRYFVIQRMFLSHMIQLIELVGYSIYRTCCECPLVAASIFP